MKVIKLDIDEENEFEGIDAIALVESPAIELDFQFFNKQSFAETYNDYPKGAIEAAKQGIKRNKAIKNKCGTTVGKQRAQLLKEAIIMLVDILVIYFGVDLQHYLGRKRNYVKQEC